MEEKRPVGRPRFYTDEEKRKNKNDYMLHKEWYCKICNNGKNYTLAGKHCHLKTKKHFKNAFTYNTGYIYDEHENSSN